jgi:ubiquinone/menaquinone biosynthesis C-methylase UbiE
MSEGERTAAQERWLRFFNAVLYNALAPVYNGLDWLTGGAWWRLVSRALDYVPQGGRVLEIGFGPGKLQVELARRSERCVGLDLAWGMCRYTQRRLRRAGLAARITQGSAFVLPYPEGAFDAVVSTFALSGLPEGADAVCEMARVTAPGGRVVLVDIGLLVCNRVQLSPGNLVAVLGFDTAIVNRDSCFQMKPKCRLIVKRS